MRAIITAAGQGKRLLPYTKDRPKSLVNLGGKPIIEYTLDNLSACGIKEVVIVIGYCAEKYKEIIGAKYKNCKIIYVKNKNYATTDNMASLWMARDYIDEGYIFINADVLFEKELLAKLITEPHPDVCVVDDTIKLSPTAMKLKVVNGKIAAIGRDLTGGNARAIGMYKYSPEGAKAYFREIEKLTKSGIPRLQIEQPLELFLKHHDMYVLRTGKLLWEEIDDENDLKKAEKNINMLTR